MKYYISNGMHADNNMTCLDRHYVDDYIILKGGWMKILAITTTFDNALVLPGIGGDKKAKCTGTS
jgi:hypothetical protein